MGDRHRISDGRGTPLNPRFWKWARGATGDPCSHTERDSQRLKASLNAAQPRKKKNTTRGLLRGSKQRIKSHPKRDFVAMGPCLVNKELKSKYFFQLNESLCVLLNI